MNMPMLNGGYIIAATLALAYGGWLVWQKPSNLRTIVKTLAIGSLSLLSFRLGGPLLLTMALGLSAIGDAFLANEGEKNFLFGLGAFLLAHLAYTALFLDYLPLSPTLPPDVFHSAGIGALVLIALFFSHRLWPHLGAMRLPVALYICAILAMGISAVLMQGPLMVLVGAMMFMASDIILSHELFVWKEGAAIRRISPYLIWGLYWSGQALIAWAWLAAL
jgi:uncharacterized membrane protein YhhN